MGRRARQCSTLGVEKKGAMKAMRQYEKERGGVQSPSRPGQAVIVREGSFEVMLRVEILYTPVVAAAPMDEGESAQTSAPKFRLQICPRCQHTAPNIIPECTAVGENIASSLNLPFFQCQVLNNQLNHVGLLQPRLPMHAQSSRRLTKRLGTRHQPLKQTLKSSFKLGS